MAPRNTIEPTRRMCTLNEAALVLGVDPRTVRRMIGRGELTAYRVGRTRITRLDLDMVEGLLRPIITTGGAA